MKKTLITLGIAGTLALGGVAVTDSQIDPYTDKGDRMEIMVASDVIEAGEAKVELMKDKPKVIFSKWNDEIRLSVSYGKVEASGDRDLLSDKMKWKGVDEEVHAYPLENGDFEIEVVLNKKPDTNVFEFQLDGYEDLDFWYQPELTQTELDEGAFRPENVVGSYAVYHKVKANHIIGQTNYQTGKAYHIYRPKVIDDNGVEVWGELNYNNGILSVIVPQGYLDNAKYPVRVDPTFGFTDVGGTTSLGQDRASVSKFTLSEDGDVTKMTTYAWKHTAGDGVLGTAIYDDAVTSNPEDFQAEDSGDAITTTAEAWLDTTITVSLTTGDYWLAGWGNPFANFKFDSGGDFANKDGETYETWADPYGTPSFESDRKISIYATYTADAPADSCTYSGTGNWEVNYTDNCYITSEVYVVGECRFINDGAGSFGISSTGRVSCSDIRGGAGFMLQGAVGARLFTR